MIEIDGPRQAFFMDSDCRIVYKTIALGGKSPNALVNTMDKTIEKIKELARPDAVLYWRKRPELIDEEDANEEPTGLFKIVCRLAVHPDLTEKDWNALGYVKAEGEPVKMI